MAPDQNHRDKLRHGLRSFWGTDSLPIATFHCEGSARCCACAEGGRIVTGDEGGRIYFLALEE